MSNIDEIIVSHLNDEASTEDVRFLFEWIREDPEHAKEFARCSLLHAQLRRQLSGENWIRESVDLTNVERPSALVTKRRSWHFTVLAAAACMLVVVGASVWWGVANRQPANQVAARLVSLQNAQWKVRQLQPQASESLEIGRRLELTAGQVEIEFLSGAKTRLYGPAVFDIESSNSGFLFAGRARSQCDTPKSTGFAIRTHNATFIDRGTEFLTRVRDNGHSQVEVTAGQVEVEIPGQSDRQQLGMGTSLGIEPGDAQVVVLIERGDETPAFQFASIEPPSKQDLADASLGKAQASVLGTLGVSPKGLRSGQPSILLDGTGQSAEDNPSESLYFEDNTDGMILLDLGQSVSISKINTYSWHQHAELQKHRERAVQRFTLWGFEDDQLPATKGEYDPSSLGWVRIASVDSDAFFGVSDRLDRPAQQACSITTPGGALGQYRYLLFKVRPSPTVFDFPPRPSFTQLTHTLYAEIDVYGEQIQ